MPKDTPSTEVAVDTKALLEQIQAAAASISDPAAMMDFFEQQEIGFSEGEEISDGYENLTGAENRSERDRFLTSCIGEPVFIVEWEFRESDYEDREEGGEYVTIHAMSRLRKVMFNIGGSGMRRQLRRITDHRIEQNSGLVPTAGLVLKTGFRKSEGFYYNKTTKKALTKQEMKDTPDSEKALSQPVWYLDI